MSWVAVGTAAVTTVGGLVSGSMGESGGATSTSQSNPALQSYTSGYSGAAPWGFQTLDPGATLAGIRSKNLKNNQSWLWDKDGRYVGPSARRKELQALKDAEDAELESTNSALERIKKRQESGNFITPQETDFINKSLDKAFEYASTVGMQEWTKGTQMMAGSRGLRMSDTPAAEPALKELRNLQLGLASKRAELGLNATMDMAKTGQVFDQSFVEFNKTLAQNRMATRQGFLFGGGMSGIQGGSSVSSGTTSNMPSMMSNIRDFSGMAGNALMALGSRPGGSTVPTPSPSRGYGGGMGLTSDAVGGMFG